MNQAATSPIATPPTALTTKVPAPPRSVTPDPTAAATASL